MYGPFIIKMSCNTSDIILIISNVIVFLLWVTSELLSMSSCKSNGVIQFISRGFCLETGVVYSFSKTKHDHQAPIPPNLNVIEIN